MRATNCRDGLREAVAGKSSMRFGRRRSARSPSEAAEGRSDPIRGDPRLLGIELARHSFIAPPVRTLLSYGSTNCFCRAARRPSTHSIKLARCRRSLRSSPVCRCCQVASLCLGARLQPACCSCPAAAGPARDRPAWPCGAPRVRAQRLAAVAVGPGGTC